MTVNQGGVIQKIKLKYKAVIGTIIAIMIYANENPVIRSIIISLMAFLAIVAGIYFIAFGWFLIHPSSQGISILTELLISYFVVAIPLIAASFYYLKKIDKTIKKFPKKNETDNENLETLRTLVIEDLRDSINKKESDGK
jgi:membrane protein implicated in regulation of membrane protease activity